MLQALTSTSSAATASADASARTSTMAMTRLTTVVTRATTSIVSSGARMVVPSRRRRSRKGLSVAEMTSMAAATPSARHSCSIPAPPSPVAEAGAEVEKPTATTSAAFSPICSDFQ